MCDIDRLSIKREECEVEKEQMATVVIQLQDFLTGLSAQSKMV